jgi:malate dehydrogenase (oxaloacetate-decarboxylating)(NADP+)
MSDDALHYHESERAGKIEVLPSKPCRTQRDLALAYTPGVALPCTRIAEDPDAVFRYTARGNLVAVVTNGTAVLGLGDIGPLAGKPVMEGKGVLFKRFADIDVFDLEIDTRDADAFIECVKLLEPTFGGVNLEDIAAPDCFHIERTLQARMDIPVFHDDQHGTAIISAAAFLNALELTDRAICDARIVFAGAGAAGIACAHMLLALGANVENVLLVDSRGVLREGRDTAVAESKAPFVRRTERRTLADALRDADAFIGVARKNLVSAAMLETMAPRPIVFAMANPDPEIDYDLARATRPDAIVATGRSDFPNQVNNVLGFPSIFRGALDARASSITQAMKIAAVHALAALAREPVPDSVRAAYDGAELAFGPHSIIPKPFDPRVLLHVAPAVARAAAADGIARTPIADEEEYRAQLVARMQRLEPMLARRG